MLLTHTATAGANADAKPAVLIWACRHSELEWPQGINCKAAEPALHAAAQ